MLLRFCAAGYIMNAKQKTIGESKINMHSKPKKKRRGWLIALLILLILNLIRTCRTAASIVRQEEQQALREGIELARKRQAQDAPPSESDES